MTALFSFVPLPYSLFWRHHSLWYFWNMRGMLLPQCSFPLSSSVFSHLYLHSHMPCFLTCISQEFLVASFSVTLPLITIYEFSTLLCNALFLSLFFFFALLSSNELYIFYFILLFFHFCFFSPNVPTLLTHIILTPWGQRFFFLLSFPHFTLLCS